MSTGTIQFLVGIGIVGMQNLLGRLNHAYWGAIFPGFFFAYLIYGYVTGLFKEGSEWTLGSRFYHWLGRKAEER